MKKRQEDIVENMQILIVSDAPDRTHYLSHHIRLHHMKPIRYPNHLSAIHALKVDSFRMIVVDLTLPIDSKIQLIKTACVLQKNARVIAIGKKLYLEKSGVLNDFPSVELITEIDKFPETLAV
jgi:DNA-binding response OmpR family regulator